MHPDILNNQDHHYEQQLRSSYCNNIIINSTKYPV